MKETTDDYSWQTAALTKWDENGRRGILQAVPGAGKTRAGIRIIEHIWNENPEAQVLILCPTNTIINQWNNQIKSDNLQVMTYFKGAKLANAGYKTDLLILDECHSILSPKRQASLKIQHKWLLGLSATPLNSDELLGPVFMKIDWKQANVAPFQTEYIYFSMTPEEHQTYIQLSEKVKRAMKALEEDEIDYDDCMSIIMQRRGFVYTLPQRILLTVKLIKNHPNDRIMIFSERLEQVSAICTALSSEGIDAAVYTTNQNTFEKYKQKQTRVLISSKMLKEGFDDPETTVGILASTPLTERNYIQTVGRIIRYLPEKKAKIYILLARGTTDEKLPDNVNGTSQTNRRQYSFDHREKIFRNAGTGFDKRRIYTKEAPKKLVKILRTAYPLGWQCGRFYIDGNGTVSVYIKKQNHVLDEWRGTLEWEETKQRTEDEIKHEMNKFKEEIWGKEPSK